MTISVSRTTVRDEGQVTEQACVTLDERWEQWEERHFEVRQVTAALFAALMARSMYGRPE